MVAAFNTKPSSFGVRTGAVRYPQNDQVVSSTSQRNSVLKKADNHENEQYPLIFKAKKKVLVPNYTVPDQYVKALIFFPLFKTEVFLSFGS